MVVGETANICEVIRRQESVERVAVHRHRQEQPEVNAVEGRHVPAIGSVIVHHVGIAAGGRPEERCEGLVEQDATRSLVEHTDLCVDRLDDKVVTHGCVGIGRQAGAV